MKPTYIDINYLGQPNLIACAVLPTRDGIVLIDPGPTVALPSLAQGLKKIGYALQDVCAVLLTHIHLDHAGATGTLVRQAPNIDVYVHAIGAKHLVAPERLLRSAGRIYGDQMDTLWGAFEAVPQERVHKLGGGEVLQFGETKLDVAYTPGHAVHHVSYFNEDTGIAYVGDVAGMRVSGCDYVLPVAPPPDVHIPCWEESLAIVSEWAPETLFVTHFGPSGGVETHLAPIPFK